ncbi:MAG: hypothetical protein AB2693_27030 [Candidatus Thiodiazotropha sp.]
MSKILKFTTGSEEEPVLGFHMKPSVHFVHSHSFLPTANTCINRLNLTIPAEDSEMPEDDMLFSLFDYAFSNSYFGLQ